MKYTKLIPTLLLALTTLSAMKASDNFNDLFTDPDIVNALETSSFNIPRAIDDKDVVEVLISLRAAQILQNDIYLQTHELNKRNILDNSLLGTSRTYYKNDWVLGGHLFWNQTEKTYFTKDSPAISTYLAISSPDIMDELDSPEVKAIISDFSIDPLAVLPLFNCMTVQERKFGAMFNAARQFKYATIRGLVPFYYIERNFFLPQSNQEALEDMLGKGDQDAKELFAKNHLISDQVGFGDTRLTVDFSVIDKASVAVDMGALITLPTAFAFKKGLMGKHLKRNTVRPTLDFNKIFELGKGTKSEQDQASALAEKFFLTVIDNLGANLLQTSLGNGGHFGGGMYIRTKTPLGQWIKRPWTNNFSLQNTTSLEYLFPADEQRSFIAQDLRTQFNALGLNRSADAIIDQANDDPVYADKVVSFLEAQTINQLIPFAYMTKVYPGFIFRSTSRINYDYRAVGLYIGSDFWLQTKERLRDIQSISKDSATSLNVDKATRMFAYQCSLNGSLSYKIVRPTKIWTLSLSGAKTLLSSGIGQDFTISLNIEANF